MNQLILLISKTNLMPARTPDEIEKKWTYLDTRNIVGGFYASSEAMVHPFGLTWVYFEALKKMGVPVEKENRVTLVEERTDRYFVQAEYGDYLADKLVIASSVMSESLVEPLGYYLHLNPVRKEMVISEPVRPFFGPTIERP